MRTPVTASEALARRGSRGTRVWHANAVAPVGSLGCTGAGQTLAGGCCRVSRSEAGDGPEVGLALVGVAERVPVPHKEGR